MDTRGKLSLDLLIGLSIFLMTFIYVVNFMPGVFADVRYEISLGNQAYRLAALFAEDPGYPADWEDEVTDSNCNSKIFRPGFAHVGQSNYLIASKIKKFEELASNPDCRDVIRDSLGLNLSNREYYFNIRITYLNGTAIDSGGDTVPEQGQILSFERIVYVDNCTALPCDNVAGRCVCKLRVMVWV